MIPDSLRFPPGGRPWLLYGLVGVSLVLNLGLAMKVLLHPDGAGPEGPVAIDEPAIVPVGGETDVSNPPVPPDQVAPLPEPKGVAHAAGTFVYTGVVTSSLSTTFQAAEGTNPAALSAVYSRLFAWDLDLRRDIHKGDVVEVLYEQPTGVEPMVLAARFKSKAGTPEEKAFSAFRYQAPGDRFPSYWSATGEEVPRRLIDGPLGDYEQITSLLKDRPTHKGMDFKTPIGTDVVAPRAGKVVRTNWNHAANGNCIEVRFSDGVLAKFLHLNENAVKDGQSVTAGTVLGKSGNTGHSTGPHLHYQLERGSGVVDPISYHGTLRRQLQPDAMAAFELSKVELEKQLDGRIAQR